MTVNWHEDAGGKDLVRDAVIVSLGNLGHKHYKRPEHVLVGAQGLCPRDVGHDGPVFVCLVINAIILMAVMQKNLVTIVTRLGLKTGAKVNTMASKVTRVP